MLPLASPEALKVRSSQLPVMALPRAINCPRISMALLELRQRIASFSR
jgi:hypothetical protein